MTCLRKNNFTPSSIKVNLKFKWIFISILALLAIAAAVALREYMLLKKIQATLMKPPGKANDQAAERPAIPPQKLRLVENIRISEDGSRVSANVRFSLFKNLVEQNPEILRTWGRLAWKVLPASAIHGSRGPSPSVALEDVPALCFKALSPSAPMAPLGAEVGECIINLDGETVNQPMRNLGIWMTLGSREHVDIETRRAGRKIAYRLNRIP